MEITPASANAALAAGTTNKRKSTLDMEQFMMLLSVQLATQNPLEPMSDRDFFAQMAQLGTVQGIDTLRTSIEMTQASALIGKTVVAVRPFTDAGGAMDELVTGVVKGMTFRNGDMYLTVREANGGTVDIRIGNIQSVSETPTSATS
jgi:flagellar basal-body rod modification protein FlgD